jgi:hypothetical protein
MDVSGRVLGAWMPAIHAGMTEGMPLCIYTVSFCGAERKILERRVRQNAHECILLNTASRSEQSELSHRLLQLFQIAFGHGR